MTSLYKNGFKIIATEGTAQFYQSLGIQCDMVFKVSEGRPNVVDLIKNREIDLIINPPADKISKDDAFSIRQAAVRYHVPIMTTIQAAKASIRGLLELKKRNSFLVKPIQDYHKEVI